MVAPASLPPAVMAGLTSAVLAARRALVLATNQKDRRRAEHRVRVLHAAVALLNHLDRGDAALEHAAKPAAKMLEALGIKDLYSDGDGRGRSMGKRMLLAVMGAVLQRQLLAPGEIGRADATRTALSRAGMTLRAEREAPLAFSGTPSPDTPLSVRLAWDLYTYGLCDDAAVAMFGPVPEGAIIRMACALHEYAAGLDQHHTPKVEDLCAHALYGAGLLNVKERSEFFGRMA